MHQSEYEVSVGTQAPAIGLGLWYDAEKLILEGIYLDEVSAYRARRSWIRTFEMNFLLEDIHDFRVRVVSDTDERRYHVQCSFTSACGRYAFWRLTHHQAPEVQFTLETAHLPHISGARFEDSTIEPECEATVPQGMGIPSGELVSPDPLTEALKALKREATRYLRKARSLTSHLRKRH